MSREEIAAFLASLKKLRDGLDDFNCQLAGIDGAGMRLGLLCEETAAVCPAAEFQQGVEAVQKRRCVIGGWLASWQFSIVAFRRTC